jgi:hypothetical protein
MIGSVMATVVTRTYQIGTQQSRLEGLGVPGYGEVAETIGRDRHVIAMIEFIRPFYLPIAWQKEYPYLMVPQLERVCHRLVAVVVGSFFLYGKPASRFQ